MPDDPKPLAVVPDPPAVSPTGAPMLPAKLAPYFFAAATVCGIVAGASKIPGLNLPESVFGWATLGATLFAALAGMTPGWRKAAPLVLLFIATAAFAESPDAGCFDNLCGMDSYCSCHRSFTPEYPGQARCYASAPQCEIDLACCARSGQCKGSPRRGDACTNAVIAAVRKDGGR